VALALAACGDNGDDATQPSTGADSTQTAAAAGAEAASATEMAATPAAGGGGGDRGSATLTIGDETWEFDVFQCVFGHENTRSDVYSFVSDSRGQHSNGNNLQMQATIRDDAGQGRYEGDVVFEVQLDDISDFANPSVSWSASSGGIFGGGDLTITIDGDDLTAEGTFDDGLTDAELEAVPGTLEGTCGAGSLR
jgi:hypothetical protein